jgi:hypothetical protein
MHLSGAPPHLLGSCSELKARRSSCVEIHNPLGMGNHRTEGLNLTALPRTGAIYTEQRDNKFHENQCIREPSSSTKFLTGPHTFKDASTKSALACAIGLHELFDSAA